MEFLHYPCWSPATVALVVSTHGEGVETKPHSKCNSVYGFLYRYRIHHSPSTTSSITPITRLPKLNWMNWVKKLRFGFSWSVLDVGSLSLFLSLAIFSHFPATDHFTYICITSPLLCMPDWGGTVCVCMCGSSMETESGPEIAGFMMISPNLDILYTTTTTADNWWCLDSWNPPPFTHSWSCLSSTSLATLRRKWIQTLCFWLADMCALGVCKISYPQIEQCVWTLSVAIFRYRMLCLMVTSLCSIPTVSSFFYVDCFISPGSAVPYKVKSMPSSSFPSFLKGAETKWKVKLGNFLLQSYKWGYPLK